MGHEVALIKQHMGPRRQRPAGWSILVIEKEKFHDLTQDGLPSVGARVGLGTPEELTSYTQGFTGQVHMGAHVTPKKSSQRGTPQGEGQSIHGGNMNTLSAVVMANRHYKRYLSYILGSVQLVWVDDVFALTVCPSLESASRGPAKDHPMQGVLVNTLTHRQPPLQDVVVVLRLRGHHNPANQGAPPGEDGPVLYHRLGRSKRVHHGGWRRPIQQ